MKRIWLPLSLFALTVGVSLFLSNKKERLEEDAPEPTDYQWIQRAFPYNTIPENANYNALAQVKSWPQNRGNGLEWELAGPTNTGGRITDIAVHPSDASTVYAASASGGVWKSSDAGQNWAPVSDALPCLSIGDIAIDPSDKNTLYAGTGEPNAGGGSITYDGKGLFKSPDAGNTWTSLGLESTGSIARIEVDPQHPKRIFVAAMGRLFANNPERGVFRTQDGGASWEKVLFVNDSTGASDLVIHPLNPDTVFAVSWQRTRRPNKRVYGGPGCGIWRSVDGGDHWNKLSAGLPSSNLGRIGIAISPSQPNILYAIYANVSGDFKGVYKSTDNGDHWTLTAGGDPGYGFGWWFGQVRVHPQDPNQVYTLGIDWVKTEDGGQNWFEVSPYLHADYHAFVIHPTHPDLQYVGNDGGVFVSEDAGITWSFRPFAITQFYTSEINYLYPALFSGGAQDNSCWRSRYGGIDDWEVFSGGDGFVTLTNPTDSSIYYVESQYGGFAGSNGAAAPPGARFNWNTPYILAPNNPNILYMGAERLFRSSNGGLSWASISNDLSNGATGQGGVVYGTITSIAASAANNSVLWVGTDDGNVWTTANGGGLWTKVSANLPKRWVTRVIAHPANAAEAWVCLSGYRHADEMVHIYHTTDSGQHWESVAGNLPDVPVNDLVVDPANPDQTWYIATDIDVFSTTNAGQTWESANNGLPLAPVTDLTLHAPTRTLAAATFGRSMFRAQLPAPAGAYSPLSVDLVRVGPNPFSEDCRLAFHLFEKQEMQVSWYDLSGKKLRDCFFGVLESGSHEIICDGKGFSSGVYLLKIESGNGFISCKKVLKQ